MQMVSKSWSSNSHMRQIDLKIKKITRGKEGHYIMMKGSIQDEDITVVNIYAPNMLLLLLSRFSRVRLSATP